MLAFVVLPFLLFTFYFLPLRAFAEESWVIESFDSNISIPQNGKVQVDETIVVDFGVVAKHGIFRTIPTEGIRFDLQEVRQDGAKAITDVSSSSGETTVRIGDPDRTINGRHTYEISYEVGKVITRFDDHDEFYWNVTGTDWGVTIRRVTATVSLEGGDLQRVICFTGRLGAQEGSCSAEISAGKGEFSTTQSLSANEGLTIANSFPKGLVEDPFYFDDFIKPYWLILGSLAAVAYVVRQWWKHGRDMWYRNQVILNPQAEAGVKPLFARQTVVVEFDPPAFAEASVGRPVPLRPGEIGTLIDERVNLTDISATIVDLAVRGYLKIIEEKKGRKEVYFFEQKKEFLEDSKLREWEKEILRGIFGNDGRSEGRVALTDLQEKFYTRLEKIRKDLYNKLTETGYFPEPPDKVKSYHGKRVAALIGITALLFYLFDKAGFYWVPVPALVLLIVYFFALPLMPRKTAKGTEAVRRASGFKLFITTAQKYQQQFNERINRFDEFLPYAMVFGVVGKWAGTFKVLGIEPPQPTWYVGPGPFNIGGFSSSVNAMTTSFASTLPSQPASQGGSGFGGGGFSGGGFGGGGGGSW